MHRYSGTFKELLLFIDILSYICVNFLSVAPPRGTCRDSCGLPKRSVDGTVTDVPPCSPLTTQVQDLMTTQVQDLMTCVRRPLQNSTRGPAFLRMSIVRSGSSPDDIRQTSAA